MVNKANFLNRRDFILGSTFSMVNVSKVLSENIAKKAHIVLLGGGWGGLSAAKTIRTLNKECKIKDNIFSSKISILFIVTPLIQEQANIDLPFYIATLDKKNTIEKIEYFLINGNFKKDFETDIFKETEITTTEIINFKLTDRPEKIVIGFMIDELKLELFN